MFFQQFGLIFASYIWLIFRLWSFLKSRKYEFVRSTSIVQVREVASARYLLALLNLLNVSKYTYAKRVIIHYFLVYMYNSNFGDKTARFKSCYSIKE